jgi:DNA repair exonuclease SbcCD ATPase subunit
MLRKLFGGSSAAASTSAPAGGGAANVTINALQTLGEREEQLEKRKALLEKRINDELEKAKEFTRQKKKSQALMCLKRKKMYEQQMEQLDNLQMRVVEQKMALENQRSTTDTLSALQQSVVAQKANMKESKIENVDKILDELQESNDQLKQVQEALSTPLGGAADLDDEELLGELEDLEAEQLDQQLMEPAPVPATRLPQASAALPSVPTTKVPAAQKAKTAEELELEALQAEMAL